MVKIEKFPFEDRFFSNATLNCKEPIVFHYTNGAGALGILSTGKLWCSLASHMNDKQECRYAHQVAVQRAYHALKQSDGSLRDKFINEFRSQLERISKIKIYVACFSEAEDLLSQWRGYSGLNGYSLGFSLNDLSKLSEKQSFQISEVKYKHDEHCKEIDPIISSLLKRYDASLCDRSKIDEIFWPSMQQVAEKSAIIKHPSFAEEREWRLHSQPFSDSFEKIDFIIRNDQIVPIFKFSLDTGRMEKVYGRVLRNISFRTYKVGPGANQEERTEAIMAIIQKNNIYWVFGSPSNVPLR